MKRIGIKIVGFILALTLIVGVFSFASASEEWIHIVDTASDGSKLQVVLNAKTEKTRLSSDDIQISFCGFGIDNFDLYPYSTWDIARKICIIPDVNAQSKWGELADEKSILTDLVKKLDAEDQVFLATKTGKKEFTTDHSGLISDISKISRGISDRFQSISDSIDMILAEEKIQRAAIVLITDGSGELKMPEELPEKLASSRIPLIVISMLKGEDSSKQITSNISDIKELVSASAHGAFYSTNKNGTDGVADWLYDSFGTGYVAEINGEDLKKYAVEGNYTLQVSLKKDPSVSDFIVLDEGTLPNAGLVVSAEEPEPDVTTEPEQPAVTEEPKTNAEQGKEIEQPVPEETAAINEAESTSSVPLLWILIGGAAILLLAGAVVFIIVRKKRANIYIPKGTRLGNTSEGTSQKIMVSIAPTKKYGDAISLTMKDSLTIGSDPSKSQLMLADNDGLAPMDSTILYQNGEVYLINCATGKAVTVKSGSIVSIGKEKYRINWKLER